MNYAELTQNIQEICEQTFTSDQLAMFTKQAEQKLYSMVDLPALRRNQVGVFTTGNPYLTMPLNILYVYSMAVIKPSGDYEYLLNKDVNFIREAYPSVSQAGFPKHYAIFDQTTFIVGPTPAADYSVEAHFAEYPESIVVAGSTWLGEEFDSALLNGALIEAIRFQQGEPELIQFYETLYTQSVQFLKNLGDGKLKQDMYRSGQPRARVV